ncbi:MAG TPA: hypothetical protein VJL58_01670, partial [Pyrinomonadaceae bacterium]|nr:hypothetical protein [Pyrinomonadaceae bacterium]
MRFALLLIAVFASPLFASASDDDAYTPLVGGAAAVASTDRIDLSRSRWGLLNRPATAPFPLRQFFDEDRRIGGTTIGGDGDGQLADFSREPMPLPSLSFDGIANLDNGLIHNFLILPADMNGDIGPRHYVQIVNSLIRVFDADTGIPLSPPFKISDIFTSLGTVCSTRNDGLATVLYDAFADRWLISQTCTAFPPFRQMVAVSKTGDPLGGYF